jgi:hypothetical protein
MTRFKTLITATLLSLAVGISGLLGGCATGGGTQTAADLQAQVAAACPAITEGLTAGQAILVTLAPTSPLYTRAQDDVTKIQGIVTNVCEKNATINASSVQSLAQTALPAAADLVGLLNIPAATKTKIQQDLVLAEVALNLAGVVESQIQAAQAAALAPAPASTVAK